MLKPDKTDFAKWWYRFSSDRGIEHLKDLALHAYRAGVDAAQQVAEADRAYVPYKCDCVICQMLSKLFGPAA